MTDMTREQLEGAVMVLQSLAADIKPSTKHAWVIVRNTLTFHRTQLAAMQPQPDLRAALVEARKAIDIARVEFNWIRQNSAQLGDDSGVSSTYRAAQVAGAGAAAALARIDAALGEEPTCKS